MPDNVKQDIQSNQIISDIQEIQRKPTSSLRDVVSEEDPVRKNRREWSAWFAGIVGKEFNDFLDAVFDDAVDGCDFEFEWQTPIFRFVWFIRGHADMEPMLASPAKAAAKIRRHLAAWSAYRRSEKSAPPNGFCGDPWYEWFGIERDIAEEQFIGAWEKCRYMPGHGPLQQAADACRRRPLRLPPELSDKRPIREEQENSERDYRFFVGLAMHLQVIMGDRTIQLPCVLLSEMMGLTPMSISRYRGWAETDGFITTVKGHKFRSGGRGDATEFRANVKCCELLNDRAQTGTADSFADALRTKRPAQRPVVT